MNRLFGFNFCGGIFWENFGFWLGIAALTLLLLFKLLLFFGEIFFFLFGYFAKVKFRDLFRLNAGINARGFAEFVPKF